VSSSANTHEEPARTVARGGIPHIRVCVCTSRRHGTLKALLQAIENQETADRFTHSVVVCDNDHLRSAQATVREFQASSRIAAHYCVEPRQNIALARNRAVQNAAGEFIAFIDDDELPGSEWLLTLFGAFRDGVAGVLGPVKARFDGEPPKWVVKRKILRAANLPHWADHRLETGADR
jgi:succinoglycan biosynthesis protein ExoM